jgi:hypothetical protein
MGRDMGTDESTPVPSAGVGWMTRGDLGWGLRAGPDMDLGGLGGCGCGCILLYDQTVLEMHMDAGGGVPAGREAGV